MRSNPFEDTDEWRLRRAHAVAWALGRSREIGSPRFVGGGSRLFFASQRSAARLRAGGALRYLARQL